MMAHEFALMRRLLKERSGLNLGSDKQDLLEGKLRPLLRCTNVARPAPGEVVFHPGICLPAIARKLVKSAEAVPQSRLELDTL